MTIKLSKRQFKAADRMGGALLLLAWPAGLPRGRLPELDSQRDATAIEREAIGALIAEAARRHGLIALDLSVGTFLAPNDTPEIGGGGKPQQYLCAHVVTRRWSGVADKASGLPQKVYVSGNAAADNEAGGEAIKRRAAAPLASKPSMRPAGSRHSKPETGPESTLTKLEKEMLRRAAGFALAGEWPWEYGGSPYEDRSKEERERAALQSAANKIG